SEAQAQQVKYLKVQETTTAVYRLELEVSDDTAEVVVVMFNETASSLVKCTADSIVEYEEQRIVTAEWMDESGGSSMAGGSRAFETPEFKRLLRHPSVTTPSKGEAAESDDETSFVAHTDSIRGGWESSGYKKTQLVWRVVDENSTS
nr:hypothetical protein [Tanacetum cinerariifolium]